MSDTKTESGKRATVFLRGGGSFAIDADEVRVNSEGGVLASVIVVGSRDRIAFFHKGEVAAVLLHDDEPHVEPRVTRLA